MSSLLRLNLSSYEISRLEVASFNETPRLTHLDLSRNRLRIIEQSTLAALVSSTELSLAENQLEDINGLLTTQTHLSFLNLSSNLIQWLDYAFIPNSLQILDLQVKSYLLLKKLKLWSWMHIAQLHKKLHTNNQLECCPWEITLESLALRLKLFWKLLWEATVLGLQTFNWKSL